MTNFMYWRLTDTQFKQEIKATLFEYFVINNNGIVSPSMVWDATKSTICGKISIGSRIRTGI